MYMIITEIPNDLPNMNPIRERMDVYIPEINDNLPRRNGFVYALIGAGGSGKSSLMLNFFKRGKGSKYYRDKFDNIYILFHTSIIIYVSSETSI